MSTMPSNVQVPADASRLPMTLPRLFEKKRHGDIKRNRRRPSGEE